MPVKFCSLLAIIFVAGMWSYCPGQKKSIDGSSSATTNNSQPTRLRTVKELVDRARTFDDLQSRTVTLVNLASLLWQQRREERYARQIFVRLHDELKAAAASQSHLPSTTSRTNIPRLQQMVARSLSKFDSKLAVAWFEEDLAGDDSKKALRRLDFALDLASEGNSADAARFGRSAIDGEFSKLDLRLLLSLLHRTRALDHAASDSLFLHILSRVSLQPRTTAEDLLLIGNYLFINDSNVTAGDVRFTGVRVAGLYFPVGISGERAALTKQLVKVYLETALTVLNRQLSDPSTQFPKRYAATARMMLEKAQKFAPDLVPAFTALARDFAVSDVTNSPLPSAQSSSSKLVNYEEVAADLEKLEGAVRDERCLALAATAYLQNDLETASKLVELVVDENRRVRVRELIAFRRGANFLEAEDGLSAEKIGAKLKTPELIVLLQLGLANLEISKGQESSALSHLQSALTQLREHEITCRGLYLLNVAVLLVKIEPNTTLQVFDQAAKAFDDSPVGLTELYRRDHLSNVQVGRTTAFFSLESKSIPFGKLENSIVTLFRHAQSQILPALLRMKNEKVLGPALVAVAKELLSRKTSSHHASSEARIVVLREQQLRDRVKTEILPKYPREALQDKSSGLVVVQIDFNAEGVVTKFDIVEAADPRFGASAINALKQWRFNPVVTSDGTAATGRGKITFYFFWREGRGWCANPIVFDKNRAARNPK